MRIRTLIYTIPALLLAACSFHGPKTDSTVGSWRVMTAAGGKNTTLCYAGTTPVTSTGNIENRDNPFFMITRRNSGKIEISVSSGYPYKHGSKVDLIIDKKTYHLFFKTAVAWTRSDGEDKAIVQALKNADSITVSGISTNGVHTTDTYSSEGFADALTRVRKLCP